MKKLSLGTWITLNNPSIAEIMASFDFDWLCVDIEHSVIDYFETQQLITTIQSKGKSAFVRVGENDPLIIKRVLDAGADGIIVPSVNSHADALKAVEAVFYPPFGKRGVGLARAQKYGFGFEEYRDNKAKEVILIAQIEHINAISELERIIETEGVSGTFIGPYDLSGSIGKPGMYDDPEVIKALAKYEENAKRYDKFIGYHVIKPEHSLIVEKINRGYNFIAFSTDALFLGATIKNELDKLNKSVK